LEARGWIDGSDGQSAQGRRIKIYQLTRAGRRQLAREVAGWRLLAAGVDSVLQGA
jgi:DNA-binding PadR family transcriptional regulator